MKRVRHLTPITNSADEIARGYFKGSFVQRGSDKASEGRDSPGV